jgi:hypothetical protein
MSRTEMKEKNEGKSEHTISLSQSMDSVKNQLMTYGNQIQEYLGKIDAKVENYKFSVEKTDSGLSIDCHFKATLQANGS